MKLHKKDASGKLISEYFEKKYDLVEEFSNNRLLQLQNPHQVRVDHASCSTTVFAAFVANIVIKLTRRIKRKINHCLNNTYWGNGEGLTFKSCKSRGVSPSPFSQYQIQGNEGRAVAQNLAESAVIALYKAHHHWRANSRAESCGECTAVLFKSTNH